jgi:hypothetical protein
VRLIASDPRLSRSGISLKSVSHATSKFDESPHPADPIESIILCLTPRNASSTGTVLSFGGGAGGLVAARRRAFAFVSRTLQPTLAFLASLVQGLGFKIEGLGLRDQGLGFRIEGLGFRV